MMVIITSRLRNTDSGYVGVSLACSAEQQEYISQKAERDSGGAE